MSLRISSRMTVVRVTGPLVALVACAVALTAPPARAQLLLIDVNPDVSNNADADAATGGRVNALGVAPGAPQVVYAASELGGLFRSADGGVTWAHVDGHLPTRTQDVVVDLGNTNRVFATSVFDGRVNSVSGIQVSTDAGVTWSHPATATPPAGFNCVNPADQPAAFGISQRPDASQNVFVGTNCGLAISADSGATWNFIDPRTPAGAADNVFDVLVQAGGPTGQGIIDVCGDRRHWRSTDGGATWTGGSVQLPAGRCSLAASPDEAYVLFVYAADNNIYESDDGGGTWTNLGTPDSRRQGRVPFVAVNDRAGTAFDLWAGDVRLFRTGCTTPAMPAQGGANRCPAATVPTPMCGCNNACQCASPPANWAGPFTRSAGAHDDVGHMAFQDGVAVDACPTLFVSDGGAHRNTDLGADCQNPNWVRSNVGLHALWLWALDGADQAGDGAEDLYFGTQDNGSFGTTDAPAMPPTWNNPNCCDVFSVVADPNRVLYDTCCGISMGMFVSTIRLANPGMTGSSAIPAAQNPPGTLPTFTFPDAYDTFGNQMYGAATTSGVFTTTNITANPITWTQLGAATSPASPFALLSPLAGGMPTFYATAANQVFRFVGTGAGNWQRIDNQGGLPGGFSVFASDPVNPNRLYAATLAGFVFSSTDGGTIWTADANLDALMTGNGAFLNRVPTLLAFDPEDPDVLVAGGEDSGVFLSLNAGQTWQVVTDPLTSDVSGVPHLPEPRFAYFDHEPADTLNVYIGTRGRGVWRVQMAGADLEIAKTDDPDPVTAGRELTYEITVRNNGPGIAMNTTVIDTLPAGVTFVSDTDACVQGPVGTLTCSLGDIMAGDSVTFEIVVKVAPGLVLPPDTETTITNEVIVASDTFDPFEGNNMATEDTVVEARLNHFMCYELRRQHTPRRTVSLVDAFGPGMVEVDRLKRFCNPADKNDEDPGAPLDPDHLTGYVARQPSPRFHRLKDQVVLNQFGTFTVEVRRPELMLVPSAKSLAAPPGPLADPLVDHFKCHRVKRARARLFGLKVDDQFGTLDVDVKRPRWLCSPSDKNGEGIIEPIAHLLCYEARTRPRRPAFGGPFFVHNQFDALPMQVSRTTELCVPSVVNP